MPRPSGDTAGRDDRHPHRIDHLRHQRKRAGLLGDIVGQEHAAVAARLRALRDDDVGAVLLQPDRFLHDGADDITIAPAALTRLTSAGSGSRNGS
jgi:hypothetical protein